MLIIINDIHVKYNVMSFLVFQMKAISRIKIDIFSVQTSCLFLHVCCEICFYIQVEILFSKIVIQLYQPFFIENFSPKLCYLK